MREVKRKWWGRNTIKRRFGPGSNSDGIADAGSEAAWYSSIGDFGDGGGDDLFAVFAVIFIVIAIGALLVLILPFLVLTLELILLFIPLLILGFFARVLSIKPWILEVKDTKQPRPEYFAVRGWRKSRQAMRELKEHGHSELVTGI